MGLGLVVSLGSNIEVFLRLAMPEEPVLTKTMQAKPRKMKGKKTARRVIAS
jgi:hypothetical protein